MSNLTKKAAGVMLDPDVVAFLTEVAGPNGRGRSRVINYIIRWYAQQMEAKQRAEARQLDRTISF